jgi:glucose-1-phosphate thymidylyltransferase
MLAGIQDILIITNTNQVDNFKKILNNGEDFGIRITYLEQEKPNGLPEAFILGEKFIENKSVALILGDNFFYGQGFTKRLKEVIKNKDGSTIFAYPVINPQEYGVVELNNKKVVNIKEKPKKTKSRLAITGLYFFDKNVSVLAKELKPSKRNELEIVDLIKAYLRKNKLKVELMGRGSAWLDTGNPESLFDTSQFIQSIEKRQGLKVGCPEEIAWRMGFITTEQLEKLAIGLQKSGYGLYLSRILK